MTSKSTALELLIIAYLVLAAVKGDNDLCGYCSCMNYHIICEGTIDLSLLSKYDGSQVSSIVISDVQEGTLSGNDFLKLTDISELQLESNSVHIEPDVFCLLTKLINLRLRNNSLETVSSSMLQTNKNIKNLDLSWNHLKEVNFGVFGNMKKLTRLNLSNNRILLIENEGFEELPALKELDLSNNRLQRLESGALSSPGALKHLSVRDNLLEELDPGSLAGLHSLEALDASGNRLLRVEARELAPLRRLRELRLGGNRVASLAPELVELLAERPDLSAQLEPNPLRCDCDAGELRAAWQVAAARGLNLSLTCTTGQPWDAAMRALTCDNVPDDADQPRDPYPKPEVTTTGSNLNTTKMITQKVVNSTSLVPSPLSLIDNTYSVEGKGDFLMEFGKWGNETTSLEFIVLLILISLLALITICVVIILFAFHIRVKRAVNENERLLPLTNDVR